MQNLDILLCQTESNKEGLSHQFFFSLYIDPLLDRLRMSGFGCHIKGVYMGALSYADDITIMCPSIGGRNEMLKICHNFAQSNSIIFNNKKTVCIKFGREIVKNKKAMLDTHALKWMDKVKHHGNYINKDCNEIPDCNFKKSLFIGYVNKLRSNFGMLQSNVLINLFKSYCCSFYGSHLWKFNSIGFDKCCKAWNIAIRKLLELPYNAHVYLLGPLVKQINIREQLYVRNYRFLWNAFRSRNHIVSTFMKMALVNSNTCIGYKLAFYRYRYNLDMHSNINYSIKLLSSSNLSDEQVAIVNNLSTLLSVISGSHDIHGFNFNEVNDLIHHISTM